MKAGSMLLTAGGREQARIAGRVRTLLGGDAGAVDENRPLLPTSPERGFTDPSRGAVRVVRWQPGRRATLGVAAAMVIAAAATLAWLLSSRPQPIPVTQPADGSSSLAVQGSSSPSTTGTPTGSGGAGTASGSSAVAGSGVAGPPNLVVYVAGQVRHPGIYHLAPGARVYDAVKVAGGLSPGSGPAALNMAAKIVDGQQILVGSALGVPGSGASAAGSDPAGMSGTGTNPSDTGPVDLNSATGEQLQALPGVGPVLAQHILDWRTAHGSFTSIEQLQEVSGIGPAKFAALRGRVRV